MIIDKRISQSEEWLVIAEFLVNNKICLATKVFPYIMNYSKELRMGIDNRRKRKVKKATKLAKRMKKV